MIYSNLFSPTKNESHFHHDTPQATFCQAPLEKTPSSRIQIGQSFARPRARLGWQTLSHLWCVHFRPPKIQGFKTFQVVQPWRDTQIWGSRVVFHSEFKMNHSGETPWNGRLFFWRACLLDPEDWSRLEMIGFLWKSFPLQLQEAGKFQGQRDLVDWKLWNCPEKMRCKNEIWIINKLKPPETKTTCSHPFNS